MGRETDRLAGLVDDLFELSRIQAGALRLELEKIALDELVSDAVAGVSLAATTKGVHLRGDVALLMLVVELSIPEMARVVRNLLDNAIRHTPPGGTVWVEAALDDDRAAAVVSVRDGCGGIPGPTCRGSSSWPTGATPPARRATAAPASGWPSPGGWSRPTTARSRCRTRGRAAASPSGSRLG